jgi:sugar phosphate isomerase/epimerase
VLVLAAGSMLDCDAETMIDAAAGAGFDAVGLRWTTAHAHRSPSSLAGRARELGITIHDTEVYRIGTDVDDPHPLLAASAELGASAVLVVSDLEDLGRTEVALAGIVDAARSFGLQVGLEYMAWTTPSSPEAALAVADRTGCRIVVDVLHHTRVGAGPDDLRAVVESGHLGWIQLCDAPRRVARPSGSDALEHEARHARLVPGRGGLGLRELLDVVPADTTLSVEVQSDVLLATAPRERARLLFEAARSVGPG